MFKQVGGSYPRIAMLFSSNKFLQSCFLQNPVVTQTLLLKFQGLASNAFIFLSSKTTRSRFRTVLETFSCWKPLPVALKGKMLETTFSQLFKDPANYKSKNKPLYSTVSFHHVLKWPKRTLNTENSPILFALFVCLKAQEDLPSVPWIEKSTGTRLSAMQRLLG